MNASFSNGRYSVCTCVLKTRAATGQHWEVVDFQAGYWEQDCDRCEPPFYRFPTKKHMDCGRCEWGTISPRFNVFLLQNVNAGRCEPPFYREVSHKKKSELWTLWARHHFAKMQRVSSTQMVVLDIVHHHFIERLPKSRIVDIVSEAPFRQDSMRFFYKMVLLDVVNHHFIERLPAKKATGLWTIWRRHRFAKIQRISSTKW